MIPVVFVHLNKWDYLETVLSQARKYNGEVYLVGDQNTNDPNYCDIKDYRRQMDIFHGVYENHSSNDQWFEEACFWRWLILDDFMHKHGINRAFHLDSDVLLYANVTEEDKNKYSQYPITLIVGNCGASAFIDRDYLDGFCELLIQTYQDKGEVFEWLKHLYSELQRQHMDGGACDMVLLQLWRKRNKTKYAEMTDIVDGTTYDHIIKSPNPGNYLMKDGIKDIHFRGEFPYGTIADTGQEVKFNSLHFQGQEDRRILEYFRMGNANQNE